ncbi:YxeA family protein [Oceanobacillus jeddahense]|uniref:YxeA family protein n=1 Tax=Oceanobacillus jeddahense TaxID=1462527 RepID=UPI00069360F0|nr:YxeA family protein [Oceanobacillus jeddahense]
MKKAVKIFIGVLIILTITAVAIQKTTAGIIPITDWLLQHPVETYYVETTEDNYEKLWTGNYKYVFSGYNEEGDEQQITKVIDRELRTDAFLRIDTSGSYGKGWVEITEEEVPEEALSQLN